MSNQPVGNNYSTVQKRLSDKKFKEIHDRHKPTVKALVRHRKKERKKRKTIPVDSINTDQLEELIELKCDYESDLVHAETIRSNIEPMDNNYFAERDIADKKIRDTNEKIKKLNDVLELGNPVTTVDDFNRRLDELYNSEFHTDQASVTQPGVSDPKENTEERDARLQNRFNELYEELGNKDAACKALNKEERGQSNISYERLMKLMRVKSK